MYTVLVLHAVSVPEYLVSVCTSDTFANVVSVHVYLASECILLLYVVSVHVYLAGVCTLVLHAVSVRVYLAGVDIGG